jgi:dTMP kinase
MWSVEKVGAVSSSGMATAIPVYPELRRFYPELRTAPVFSQLFSRPERAHSVSRPANCAKLNRQTPELEHLATRRKQTPEICSNRQNFQFCLNEISASLTSVGAQHAVPADAQGSNPPRSRNLTSRSFYHRLSQFLPGSGLQVEMAVTHSKQSIDAFLPGSRFAHMRTVTPQGAYVRLASNSMPARGKFIVLEGIDGSGKRTQLDMLARAFASRNVPFAQISFPRYDRFFGKLVARYLNGEFGSFEVVDAHFSALLYAGDRFEAKPSIESDLASGKMLLADRYVGSNLAHQGARVPREKRTEFLQWLRQLEYQVYALPAEDLVIYLRVPPAEAHRLIGEKAARNYTKLQRDIHESNLAHLAATSEVYDHLAHQPNWLKIECYDAPANALRSAESIHQEILAVVQAHATPTLRANK